VHSICFPFLVRSAKWLAFASLLSSLLSSVGCSRQRVSRFTDNGDDAGDTGDDLGGEIDASPFATNVNDPLNAMRDSDCDGLSDEEEFATYYADGLRSDPGNPDSDGDGIPDGVELGRTASVDAACHFVGDADPATRTL